MMNLNALNTWTSHKLLKTWIQKQITLCRPVHVHLCTGTEEENAMLLNKMTYSGTLIPLNKEKYPNCYLARSSASDVARVENRTFICSEKKEDAGPTNNWEDPEIMRPKMQSLFEGCMAGRTMYVVPFSMGPVKSAFSAIGVQITDSPYAVVNMRIMTRMGTDALKALVEKGEFVPCMHSVGAPLQPGKGDVSWPQNNNKYICHFPETKEIWSYGSGYGGNALLGKKCYALRIASVMGHNQGWLAEHMLIMGVTNPAGEKKYFAAAFPSACGKTNFAMMVPTPSMEGWKVEVVGDDIAWIRVGKDGKLRAINPEAGYFGVAPGTSAKTNAMALASAQKNSIYTNVAVTDDGCPWWEGMTKEPPKNLTSWLRRMWNAEDGPAAHPNARFTAPAHQCPIIDPNWENPEGVPLDGIIFGGRRSDTVPLVSEAKSWSHGVYMGATMMSETTAAAEGARGTLRSDPFAMLPFCGYNMADYFAHWLQMGSPLAPKIFYVNWFRKDKDGKFIWPGFGDNIRVLDWMFRRCANKVEAVDTPIGLVPRVSDMNMEGLSLTEDQKNDLFAISTPEWKAEVVRRGDFLAKFGEKLPKELMNHNHMLQEELHL